MIRLCKITAELTERSCSTVSLIPPQAGRCLMVGFEVLENEILLSYF